VNVWLVGIVVIGLYIAVFCLWELPAFNIGLRSLPAEPDDTFDAALPALDMLALLGRLDGPGIADPDALE
jgi:hypothetical protein